MKEKQSFKTGFVCRDCGATSAKWQGQCPGCSAWNTLEETRVARGTAQSVGARGGVIRSSSVGRTPLAAVSVEATRRWSSGLDELDRVLGGGLVPGAVILVGGDPGIGKSTLMLQVLAAISQGRSALYVSGEESAAQVAQRAGRLGLPLDALHLLAETTLEAILDDVSRHSVDVLVVDSIQTLYSESLGSAPGSVVQVRECAASLVRAAKASAMAVIIVGHVTKEGAIAGPRVLEHLVDTVVYFEGDPGSSIRVLRALKNRFGPTNEIGVFAMGETGLRPVPNPSALFMAQHDRAGAGAVLFAAIEGSRPLLIQVQALVDRSAGTPRRVCTGFDSQRLAMLLAVMNRHLGLELGGYDVFVNVVGGLRVTEPAADLAIVLAVWSSLTMRSLPQGLATFGEVGLGGEVRPVVGGMLRLGEADKLGVTHVIGAGSGARAQSQLQRAQYAVVRTVGEALDAVKALA